MASVWGELKRRNVVRVAIAYAIVSWLILQLTDVLMPLLSLPEWVGGLVFLLLVIGFLLALVLSWAYELTPEGVKKERDVDRSDSVTRVAGRKLDFFIIAALSLALVFVVIDQYVMEEPATTTAVSENLRSIAVLPFTNRSAAEENAAFFADGVHDELLTRLSKIHDLKVISRTSVMEYRDTTKNMRQIAAELGVGSILEGGVQRAGDTVRINVRLINAETGEQLWAETYSGKLNATDIFATQAEISTEIAKALRATLSTDEQERIAAVPTENIEALEAFFAGNQMVDRRDSESLMTAIEYFERATKLDPDFAGAYAGLAEAWLALPNDSPSTDSELVREEAAVAAQKAFELDPESPDALATLGWYVLLYEFDWHGAERYVRRALHIEPRNTNALHWYSHILSWQGSHAEAIEMSQRALTVDPLSPLMRTSLASAYGNAGQWGEDIAIREELLRRIRTPRMMRRLWRAQLQAGRAKDAATMFKEWAAATDRSVEAAQELGAAFIHYKETGVPADISDDLIETFQFGDFDLAPVYASVGDREKTIEALQNTDLRYHTSMNVNSSYDFIRDDPRFIELLKQIGLAE